jgi:hypothetical protein
MADGGQSQKRGRAPKKVQPARSLRPLRLRTLGAILLVAGTCGIYFKLHANPGTEPSSFGSQPQQYLNVYDTDFQVPITVTVTLQPVSPLTSPITPAGQGYTNFDETVNITASPARSLVPEYIMITSSIPPCDMPDCVSPGTAFPLKNGAWPAEPGMSQALRFAVPVPLSRGSRNTWFGAVYFGPINVLYQDSGSTFGHLPSLCAFLGYENDETALIAVHARRHGQFSTVVPGLTPSGPPQLPAGSFGHEEIFSDPDPQDISYTEVLSDVSGLANEQIESGITANDGNASSYEWHFSGIGGLEPIFKAVNPDAVDSQNQAAFYSGIAFGVFAAALIALVQEIPEYRERKLSASDAQSSAP